jgi:putative endonuclease
MATSAVFAAHRRTRGESGVTSGLRDQPGSGRQWGHWLGRYGEEAAAHYLLGAGYQILDRNWVCRDPDLRGELDLVARYRRIVVACEVKTRAGDLLAHPAQAVTREKAARLRLLAARWLREHQRGASPPLQRAALLRIDVIAIRTSPRPPYQLRSLDHLVGVA